MPKLLNERAPDVTWIPLAEACRLLGVSRNTGYAHKDDGKFPVPVRKICDRYKCDLAEVEAFIRPTVCVNE